MQDARREHCPDCDRETEHAVRLEIREDGNQTDPTLRSFSREPYRIRTCQACGAETAQRMNNADTATSA